MKWYQLKTRNMFIICHLLQKKLFICYRAIKGFKFLLKALTLET